MLNYFENNLARFVHILRHLGIKVSTGETITALRALNQINLLEREHVKLALSATLVKNHDEQPLFLKAFDSFFTIPEVRRQQKEDLEKRLAEEELLIQEAEQDLAYHGEQLDLSDEEKLFYARLPEEGKSKIRDYLAASNLPEDRYQRYKPMLEFQVRGSLKYWKQRLEEEDKDLYQSVQGIEDETLAAVIGDLDANDSNLLFEDMKRIKERDLPQVTALLKVLSRKLATKISRRYRVSKKVVRLDLRRSIKSNVRYGGIIFKLQYRQKRIQKPAILLICDVSGSMARYASFVIQFIYGLSTVVRNIESFIFAEELERVTDYFHASRSFENTMVDLMSRSKIWGKGTNLHRSLVRLREEHGKLLTANTVVIILSDAKTLEVEETARDLSKLKMVVKEVIWLNTLPQAEWEGLSSVTAFQRHCMMYECYTLAHLEKIIRKQFLK